MKEIKAPLHYQTRWFIHTLITKSKFGFIYVKKNKGSKGLSTSYEVFKKIMRTDYDFNGNPIHFRIKLPRNSDLNRWAWCCNTLAQAQQILDRFDQNR